MGRAKEIIVKVIPSNIANDFVRKHHYSGKVVNNSVLHFGAFLDGKLHGAMSYGSPMDKRKVLPLVTPSLWNEMLELNRMAFDDYLPKNSESRCIAISLKLIKKNAPHIKWIISFADSTQCGDGAIYRASGFCLTSIKLSKADLWELPESLRHLSKGKPVVHRMTIQCKTSTISHFVVNKYGTHNVPLERLCKENGGKLNSGFQLRYIYLLDKKCKINVPIIPFSKINEMGARMYKGVRIANEVNKDKRNISNIETGGSIPTHSL